MCDVQSCPAGPTASARPPVRRPLSGGTQPCTPSGRPRKFEPGISLAYGFKQINGMYLVHTMHMFGMYIEYRFSWFDFSLLPME
jgi:hypothetical protein